MLVNQQTDVKNSQNEKKKTILWKSNKADGRRKHTGRHGDEPRKCIRYETGLIIVQGVEPTDNQGPHYGQKILSSRALMHIIMSKVKFYKEKEVPLEFHRVKIVQKLTLLPVEERLHALREAGFNSYRMQQKDVYLDMLTDSGTNAMSDRQLGAMMWADDAYAGSTSFLTLEKAVQDIIGKKYVVPAHQGRAAEHTVMTALVKEGDVIPMNYHFGTTITQIGLAGGRFVELINKETAFKSDSENPFKGNADINLLESAIAEYGVSRIPYIRMEASTNLIGGQPFSVANLREVRRTADKYGIRIMLDATLLAENAYLVTRREEEFRNKSLKETVRTICDLADLVYFSARKFGFAKGGVIATDSLEEKYKMDQVTATYEGFINYGGMSTKEIEAIATGLYEAMDEEYTCQSPDFISYFVKEASEYGVPMVTPAGVLGAQIDAAKFCDHLTFRDLPAAAVCAALYIAGGIRTMDGGTGGEAFPDSESDRKADMELVRIAFPRRVFTLSQTIFCLDRLKWLFDHRHMIGALAFDDLPMLQRSFRSPLKPVGDWPEKLAEQFRKDFGESR